MPDQAALPAFESAAFRKALGNFATGVTIVTTNDQAGEPIGVTASSFNSVSLSPPLVLWSIAKTSLSRDVFSQSGHFAIHILTAEQEALADRFAQSGADKFAQLAWKSGQLGSPILDDHAAVFECATRHQYDGGDHIIMVGEVMAFEASGEAPLLFHGGQYAERKPLNSDSGAADDQGDQSIAQIVAELHARLQSGRLSADELGQVLGPDAVATMARLAKQ